MQSLDLRRTVEARQALHAYKFKKATLFTRQILPAMPQFGIMALFWSAAYLIATSFSGRNLFSATEGSD